MPPAVFNRTITQVAIAQSGAGSTDLVAAPGAHRRVHVIAIVLTMTVAGTVKFTEGTGPTDLTGALPLGDNGGMVIMADGIQPVLSTNTANVKLSLVSTTGAVKGWIRYFTETD